MKQCNRCKNWLELEQFDLKGWNVKSRAYTSKCKVCMKIYRAEWMRKNREKRDEAARRLHLDVRKLIEETKEFLERCQAQTKGLIEN